LSDPAVSPWAVRTVSGPGTDQAPTRRWPGTPFRLPRQSRATLVSALAAVVLLAAVSVGLARLADRPDRAPRPAPTGLAVTVTSPPDDVITTPALTQPSPSGPADGPGTRPDPQAQAIALDALLKASTGSRAALRSALDAADNCVGTGSAAAALRQVEQQRRSQAEQAASLVVDGLANGTSIRENLVTALTHSAKADHAFAAWADQVAYGWCGHDSNYQAGLDESGLAQLAKKAFCALWNPVAAQFGLPARTEAEV